MIQEAIYVFFGLVIWAQLKHFIADYPMQNAYMLGKFKKTGWLLPLAAHAGVHFLFTFFLTLLFTESLSFSVLLGGLDFIIHFIMDRIKASPDMLGKYKALNKFEIDYITGNLNDYKQQYEDVFTGANDREAARIHDLLEKRYKRQEKYVRERWEENTKFWWSLGLDQTVHHLTDITIAFLIIKHMYGV